MTDDVARPPAASLAVAVSDVGYVVAFGATACTVKRSVVPDTGVTLRTPVERGFGASAMPTGASGCTMTLPAASSGATANVAGARPTSS